MCVEKETARGGLRRVIWSVRDHANDAEARRQGFGADEHRMSDW